MARGIQIPFTLDVRQWRRAMRTVELDLDDLADELRGVERAGEDVEDDVVAAFRRMGDRVESEAEQMRRDVSGEFGRMGRDASDELDGAVRRGGFRATAGALAVEAGQEFVQSWGEAIRSGNPAEVFREVGSNLALIGAAAGGPIGAAAGLVGSFALTTFIDAMGAAEKEAARIAEALDNISSSVFDRLRERAAAGGEAAAVSWYDAFNTVDQQIEGLAEALETEPADALVAVRQLAQEWGLDFDTVKQAVLGNEGALRTVEGRLGDIRAMQDANVVLAGRYRAEGEAVPAALDAQMVELNRIETEMLDIIGRGRTVNTETRVGAEAAAILADNFGRAATNLDTALRKAGGIEGTLSRIPANISVDVLVGTRNLLP